MIDQRNKHLTFGQTISDFFEGYVDFKGYTSRKGYWFPTLTIGISIIIILLFALRNLGAYLLTLVIITLIFGLPFLAIFVRRLRDVGFSRYSILIIIILNSISNSINYSNIYAKVLSSIIGLGVLILALLPSNALRTSSTNKILKIFFRPKEDKLVTKNNYQDYI